MPIITQKRVYRSDLKNNPTVKYLFGDNCQRVGLGGQAKEMRGEPNAVGIRTKYAPGMAEKDFFGEDSSGQMNAQMEMIQADLNVILDHLKDGGIVVLPEDGLGTGLSELPERAPETNKWLVACIDLLRKVSG